jgi:hypothetical protein
MTKKELVICWGRVRANNNWPFGQAELAIKAQLVAVFSGAAAY